MIFTHGASSIRRAEPGPPYYVDGPVIGGRKYLAVRIGSQIWMAENLDWKFEGLDLSIDLPGSTSTPNAVYMNNDEATFGSSGLNFGLCYNVEAKNSIAYKLSQDVALSSWRVPSFSDVNTLRNFINNDASLLCKDNLVWAPEWHGSDLYGFGMIPSGSRSGEKLGDEYEFLYDWFVAYHCDSGQQYFGRWLNNNPNTILESGTFHTSPLVAIRLVKNS